MQQELFSWKLLQPLPAPTTCFAPCDSDYPHLMLTTMYFVVGFNPQ